MAHALRRTEDPGRGASRSCGRRPGNRGGRWSALVASADRDRPVPQQDQRPTSTPAPGSHHHSPASDTQLTRRGGAVNQAPVLRADQPEGGRQPAGDQRAVRGEGTVLCTQLAAARLEHGYRRPRAPIATGLPIHPAAPRGRLERRHERVGRGGRARASERVVFVPRAESRRSNGRAAGPGRPAEQVPRNETRRVVAGGHRGECWGRRWLSQGATIRRDGAHRPWDPPGTRMPDRGRPPTRAWAVIRVADRRGPDRRWTRSKGVLVRGRRRIQIFDPAVSTRRT